MKLSFVVPVYNTEDYLSECLDSLLHQDIPKSEYEIIIVNDGSTDKSIEIAEDYASENSNIKILHQENGGLSAARNAGLEYAAGVYVWFIDSDDYIKKNCLSSLMDKIAQHKDPDIVAISRIKYLSNNQSEKYIEKRANGLSGREFLYKRTYQAVVQCYLFHRDFLNEHKLVFLRGIYHEDAEFTPRTLFYAQSMVFVEDILYFHRYRQGSITSSNYQKRFDDLITVAKSLETFRNKYCNTYDDVKIFDKIISYTLLYLFSLLYEYGDKKFAVKFIARLRKEKSLLKTLLTSEKSTFKIAYFVLNLNPALFWEIYSKFEKKRLDDKNSHRNTHL